MATLERVRTSARPNSRAAAISAIGATASSPCLFSGSSTIARTSAGREGQGIDDVQGQVEHVTTAGAEQDRPRQDLLGIADLARQVRGAIPAGVGVVDVDEREHHRQRPAARRSAWQSSQVGRVRPADRQPRDDEHAQDDELQAVIQPWTRAVRRVPRRGWPRRPGWPAVASDPLDQDGLAPLELERRQQVLAEANADAAHGPEKPIRNETQPERNAASGP